MLTVSRRGSLGRLMTDSCTLGGGLMILWWLSFRGGPAVIIEGKSAAHARLLAVANELGRASHFVEGFPIDSELVELIPENATFRTLPPVEAGKLLESGMAHDNAAKGPAIDPGPHPSKTAWLRLLRWVDW
jgi:hypothetical protein